MLWFEVWGFSKQGLPTKALGGNQSLVGTSQTKKQSEASHQFAFVDMDSVESISLDFACGIIAVMTKEDGV